MSNEQIECHQEKEHAKKIQCLRPRDKNQWDGNPVYEAFTEVEKMIFRFRHETSLPGLTSLLAEHFPHARKRDKRGRSGDGAWGQTSVYYKLSIMKEILRYMKKFREILLADEEMCRRFFLCPSDRPCACMWRDTVLRNGETKEAVFYGRKAK